MNRLFRFAFVAFGSAALVLCYPTASVHSEDLAVEQNQRSPEYYEKARQTPFIRTLNQANEQETKNPTEAERLYRQAFELATSSEIPHAKLICHMQTATFYYRQGRVAAGDKEMSSFKKALIETIKTDSSNSKLATLEQFSTMLGNAAETHTIEQFPGVAQRLCHKRIELLESARPLFPRVTAAFYDDRLERAAWAGLHDCYFNRGQEQQASKIWKRYPQLEKSYKQMKESALKAGRYPLYPAKKN